MIVRCADCAAPLLSLQGFRFFTDGTHTVICRDCLRVQMRIAEAHALNVRIHRAAHGHDGPGCPVCARERATELLWGDPREGLR